MTEAITREIPAEWTPQTLAAFIAELIREDDRWWKQGSWFGETIAYTATPDGRIRYRLDGERFTTGDVIDRLRRDEWSCGTTGCVAGWAALLNAPRGSIIDARNDRIIYPGGRNDEYQDVDVLGRAALDLTGQQASYLFHGGRTKDEVLEALDAIAQGESWSHLWRMPCPCGCDA
jgi:hypothetical protein